MPASRIESTGGTDRGKGADGSAPAAGDVRQAMILHPYAKRGAAGAGSLPRRDPAARLTEVTGLAQAIGLDCRHREAVALDRPRPGTLFGQGKIEEFRQIIAEAAIEVVVIDAPVSPVQQRNLERAWAAKVIDRTGLILEIFGERARTREGRLQVELAHLTYQRSRLVRSWTHLERQRGGFGFLGGPGESQLEIDRRLIGERIVKIKHELETVVRTRKLHRASRKRVPYPVVALVGYTNAGKSTLFNRLTGADVLAEDMLFATLDPTMRALQLPSTRRIILSDTVGFISDLPTHLVAAFRATLEEVLEADIILHVRDVAHPDSAAQAADVRDVLIDLGIGEARAANVLEVRNKVDLLTPEARERVFNQCARDGDAIALSALSGDGFAALLNELDRRLGIAREVLEITLEPDDGASLAWLYRHGEVLSRLDIADGKTRLRVDMDSENISRFKKINADNI